MGQAPSIRLFTSTVISPIISTLPNARTPQYHTIFQI